MTSILLLKSSFSFALSTRLYKRDLNSSRSTHRLPCSASQLKCIFRLFVITFKEAPISPKSSCISSLLHSRLASPTVINSINLPESVRIRVASALIIPAYSIRFSSVMSFLICRRSEKPRMEVRGVFISWERLSINCFRSSATCSNARTLVSTASAIQFMLRASSESSSCPRSGTRS
ncbi:hypothetical protein IMSAGC013_01608 [Lachnospiraceae bacterium]|nr:hypothetical protein IMSAGC013_01608 [Lachnospiraceae bacterium]